MSSEIKKNFITGGAGYVGAMLAPYLVSKGYEIIVYDLMIYGEDVIDKSPKIKLVRGDIRDQNKMKPLLQECDAVIHLACISNDPSFELNPDLGKSINLDSFEPLVKLSKEAGIKRFIYASSSSVYGVKKEKNVNEEMSLEPLTDYSKFKADCEKILHNYTSNDFVTIVIRPATVCGYSRRQRLDVVVNILSNLAYHKREITVFGGKQLRPNIHISDMIRAYEVLLKASSKIVNKKIYNAGYENFSVLELAEKTKSVIGHDVKLITSPTDDNRSYHVSSKKISDELGFIAKHSIEDAVRDMKNAFEKNLLPNSLDDEIYFNIKRMNSINLK